MSSRNRNARGPNRNSGSTQGEEAHIWTQIKDDIRTMVEGVNSSNDSLRNIIAQDNYIAKNKDSVDMGAEEQKLDNLLRGGVKGTEISKQQIDALYEHVTVLRALVKAREDADAQATGSSGLSGRERPSGLLSSSVRSSSARGAGAREKDRDREREREKEREKDKEKEREREREKELQREKEKEKEREREKEKERERERDRDAADIWEIDGGLDSPVPSPLGSHTRKLGGSAAGGSDRSANRDSIPPRGGDRDTPSKGDSVPPESGGVGPGTAARAKVTFFKGQDVVFKPKQPANSESTEWMLGRVQQVLGEGKSRRYKVQDADPDLPPDQRGEFRTSASNMIPIPSPGVELNDLDKGKIVLALYPDSTTFYKAEVMGSDPAAGQVSLRFEGEENSGTLQLVDRRFVVEYRN